VKKLAIFASGSGTNAQAIMQYFENHRDISIALVVCNRPGAGVIQRAHTFNVPVMMINKTDLYESDTVLQKLNASGIDWIILAGFLWLVPEDLIKAYNGKIVNIHPALLPNFGGKGMYGAKVHQAVLDSGKKVSGISIHFVNEHYDRGDIIAQFTCPVEETETLATLQHKIHKLEHRYYPETIEKLVLNP